MRPRLPRKPRGQGGGLTAQNPPAPRAGPLVDRSASLPGVMAQSPTSAGRSAGDSEPALVVVDGQPGFDVPVTVPTSSPLRHSHA